LLGIAIFSVPAGLIGAGFSEAMSNELHKEVTDKNIEKYWCPINVFTRKFADGKGSKNNIIMRIAWSACLWDSRRIAIAKTIANALNLNLENDIDKQYEADLKYKKSGY
jgi:hypothetical protein